MKAHIYVPPQEPDNRTEEQKEEDRRKGKKALANLLAISALFKDSPYSNLK